MRLSNITSLCALGTCVLGQSDTTGELGDAVAVTNNPVGKSAIAKLPDTAFFTSGSLNGNVRGSVKATTGANGAGVDFEVNFSNLPTEGGPFIYHLHVDPVDATGNCTKTLAHLDPFIRGEEPGCNSTEPSTCQVGDLSGKYGKITSDPFTAKFHDDFTSMSEGPGSYFLNRSIVFHFANKTRISCANFVVSDCYAANGTTNNGLCHTPTPTPTPTPITNDGPLAMEGAARGLVMLPLIASLFFL